MTPNKTPAPPPPAATTPTRYTSRYTAYAALTGAASPEAALARDVERWPGGKMTGFVLFISARWTAFRAANGLRRDDPLFEEHRAAFDAQLEAEVSR